MRSIYAVLLPFKTFLRRQGFKLKIQPASDVEHHNRQNHLAFELTECKREKVIIYTGTKDEIIIPSIPMGEFRLVDWKLQTLQHLSKEKDIGIINAYHLEKMGVYDELNERLYLSYRYRKYVEPLKDLQVGNIPNEYKVYFQIVAQQISEDEWKNIPFCERR